MQPRQRLPPQTQKNREAKVALYYTARLKRQSAIFWTQIISPLTGLQFWNFVYAKISSSQTSSRWPRFEIPIGSENMDLVTLPFWAYDFSIFFLLLLLPTLPAVQDFSASICPRFMKFGAQLPYDHPPRGISIYFEIPIFYRVFDFSNMLWTCKIFRYLWVLWGDLRFAISPLPFVLGFPNLVYSFLMTIPPGVFRFISKLLFLSSFWLFKSALDLWNFPITMGTMRGPAVLYIAFKHTNFIVRKKKEIDPIKKAFGWKKLAPNESISKQVAP